MVREWVLCRTDPLNPIISLVALTKSLIKTIIFFTYSLYNLLPAPLLNTPLTNFPHLPSPSLSRWGPLCMPPHTPWHFKSLQFKEGKVYCGSQIEGVVHHGGDKGMVAETAVTCP